MALIGYNRVENMTKMERNGNGFESSSCSLSVDPGLWEGEWVGALGNGSRVVNVGTNS